MIFLAPVINVFQSIEEKAEKFRFLLILLLVFSLPFDIFYSSVILITLFVTTAIDINREKIKRLPKQAWIFQLFYFIGIAGYFYSSHKDVAGFLLERQLSIFLLPLVLPLAIRIDRQKVQLVLSALTISCCIAVTYLFLSMINSIAHMQLPTLKTAFSGLFFNHQFSKALGVHAGYLSLYVSLSLFYLIYAFYRLPSAIFKVGLICLLALLFLGLLFLASRNTLIATFFVLIFVSPLFNNKNKLRYILISFLCLVTCFLAVKNVPYLRERFFVQLVSDIKPLKNGTFINFGSAEPRMERWTGALSLVEKSPLIGYGTGDEIAMLRTEYIKRELYISYLERFNAHNQYLSFLIKSGIIGFCLFLFGLYYYVKLSVVNKNFMYLSFLLLLIIGFYTENILDANKGILFFAIFNTLFGYSALQEKEQARL